MSDDLPPSLLKSIAIIPKVGGALSLIAGSAIMRDVSTKWKTKRSVALSSVVVFCISVGDWLYSLFSCFMSTWMVPVDSGYFLASGNTASCSAQGFFTTLGVVASTSYYAALAILYWLMIRPGWTERRLDRLGVKLAFLLPPAVVSFGFAIPPLFLTMYNHAGAYSCFIASKPLDCEMNSQVECERGDNAWIYWDVVWAFSMACGLAIIVFVSALVYTVFKQEKKTDKYLTPGQEKRRVNTIQTAWQGIRYVGAFLAAYITFYALSYYRHSERDPPIGLVYMHLILQPLLGLFNSFVYFRPRYLRHRARNPNDSWIISLGNVFNVDLDYLDSRRENLSKRISSISRKSVASLKLSSTISGGTRSESGDSVEDSDLTSPLFRDSIEPNENEDGVV